MRTLALVLLLAPLFLTARALQLVHDRGLRRQARGFVQRVYHPYLLRGRVVDRFGNPLALTLPTCRLIVELREDRKKHDDTWRALRELSRVLHLDRERAEAIRQRLREQGRVELPPLNPREVDMERVNRIVRRHRGVVGIWREGFRWYPWGSVAANLLGFVGRDGVGREGLEYRYDRVLQPQVLLDGGLRPPRELQGGDLRLTIDAELQMVAERALRQAVIAHRARGGMVLAMNPSTGEVLVMGMYPSFDPQRYDAVPRDRWRNRAVTDPFEPGSTFKPFVVAWALARGAVHPEERIWCEDGRYRVAGKTIRDVHSHGWLTVREVIKYSSNIGACKIGMRLGKGLLRGVRAFGFGSRTGIDLPGESPGRVPRRVGPVELATICYGQGISVTAIQLVRALCAIANGGLLMRPYVVSAVGRAGRWQEAAGPHVVRRVIPRWVARLVTSFLEEVVEEGGTGRRAHLEGCRVAGKTGTAQRPWRGAYRGYVSSFMGFLPAQRPRLAILVVIDDPRAGSYYGGETAAPVFREIARWFLKHRLP